MREIKFRAWNRKEGCWHYFSLHCGQIHPNLVEGTFAYENQCQYTGLKDKNGKGEELYAGDILKGDSPLGAFESNYPGRNIGVIVWDDQKAVWCLEWQDGRGFKMRPLLHEMISRYNHKIGNIYENPKLMESP